MISEGRTLEFSGEMNQKQEAEKPETTREQALNVPVQSYLDLMTPTELLRRVKEQIYSSSQQSKILKLNTLNLSTDATEQQIEQALGIYIEHYLERVQRVREQIPEQLTRTTEWLTVNQYVPRQPLERIHIVVTDQLLQLAFNNTDASSVMEEFHPEQNSVSISGQKPGNFLAHELIHALSHDPSTKETGFRQFQQGKNTGNQWVDEGMAVLGELATFPNARSEQDDSDKLYLDGYLWMTQLFMNELGVTQSDLFKAYFGMSPYRSDLETNVQKKFGCSITDLNDLFLGYDDDDKKTIQNILQKKPVYLSAVEGSGLDKKYLRLKQIFPLIEVDIRKMPVLVE